MIHWWSFLAGVVATILLSAGVLFAILLWDALPLTTIIRLTMDQWAFVHGELERIVETDECPRSVRRAAKEIQDTLAQEAETPLQQAAERSEAIGDE